MGNMGATAVGMEKAPVTVEQSINGMLSKVMSPFYLYFNFSFSTDICGSLTTQLGRAYPVPSSRSMRPSTVGKLDDKRSGS
jgi:hypothetical protein